MMADGIAATIAIMSSAIGGSRAILPSLDRKIIAAIESISLLYKQLGKSSS
jgi:hypothetical protein